MVGQGPPYKNGGPSSTLRRGRRAAVGENRLPVDDRVPDHAEIAAVEVAIQRIEIERDDMAATDRRIEDRWAADQVALAPRLSADDEWFAFGSTPLQHDAARVLGSVEATRAIGHAQPAPRRRIQRE